MSQRFGISSNQVNFGTVARDADATQTIQVTNLSGSNVSFRVMVSQPWVHVQFGQPGGNSLPVAIRVDGSGLSGKGLQQATVKIIGVGHAEQVIVSASVGGGSAKQQPIQLAKATAAVRHLRASFPLLPMAASLLLTSMTLAAFFSCLFGIVVGFCGTTPNGLQAARIVLLLLIAGYLVATFGRVFMVGGTPVTAGSSLPEHQRIWRALTDVCAKIKLPMPRVVIHPDPRPNLRSYGLAGKLSVMRVNQGLLQAIPDEKELSAVLAHEVTHMRHGDTLFLTAVGPLLMAAHTLLDFATAAIKYLRTASRGRTGAAGSQLFSFLNQIRPRDGWGLLIFFLAVFMVGSMLLMLLLQAVVYAVTAIAGLALVVGTGFAYLRHTEARADQGAIAIIGDSDLLLVALARCVDHFPSERASLDQYAASSLSSGANYSLADIIRNLKAAGAPLSSRDWKSALVASHPSVLNRIASVVRRCGSKIA